MPSAALPFAALAVAIAAACSISWIITRLCMHCTLAPCICQVSDVPGKLKWKRRTYTCIRCKRGYTQTYDENGERTSTVPFPELPEFQEEH